MEREHHLKAQAFQRAELFRLIELYLLKLGNRSTCSWYYCCIYFGQLDQSGDVMGSWRKLL